MNLNQRRPTGTHLQLHDKQRKSDLKYYLHVEGLQLAERHIEGTYGKRREIFVVNHQGEHISLDIVDKGEAVNWDQITWDASDKGLHSWGVEK